MEKIDRRIQKTKKLLSESLIALILERGYENITVQEILDRANVGRSTFYSHYEGKDQLFLAGPKNLGVEVFDLRLDGGSADPDFLPLFRHIAGNLPLGKAMLGRKSGEFFMGHLQAHLAGALKDRYKGRFGRSKSDQFRLRAFSAAAGASIMAFVSAWLEEDLPVAAEEMSSRCGRAVTALFQAGFP